MNLDHLFDLETIKSHGPHTKGVILFTHQGTDGVYRIFHPDHDLSLPGILFYQDGKILPWQEKKEYLSLWSLSSHGTVIIDHSDPGVPVVFIVIKIHLDPDQASKVMDSTKSSWMALPFVLKRMAPNRRRLGYLKIWQFLQGVHEDEVFAISQKEIQDLF